MHLTRREGRILALRQLGLSLDEIATRLDAAAAAGTDPGDPHVQKLAARWRALIEQFTGGDPALRASLQKMYENEGPERASRGMVDAELMAHMGKAMDLLDS